jgi:heme/copper-type cytochrome/quinol oxidase subunit 1
MHPLRHPRNAAMVGIIFIIIGAIYWIAPSIQGTVNSDDIAAGTTLLVFLGVAMALMAYVLVAGSTDE